MSAEASSRLRTQAGTVYSATPRALSYLLNLSLNPATNKHQLIAAVESDPAILAEFLALETPEHLALWHEPFNHIHFLVTAARLALVQIQRPPSLEQWQTNIAHWQGALFQQYLAENVAQALNYPSPSEAKLTGLLASTIEDPALNLPDHPRDAIRFKFASAEALKDTHQLVRIIATTSRLEQDPKGPIEEDYLADWDLPGINLSAEIKSAREKVSLLINAIPQADNQSIDRYDSDLRHLSHAVQRFQYKIILDQQFAATDSLASEVNQLGAALFELRNCAIFELTEDGFRHDATTITAGKSIVAKAAETKSIVSSAGTSMIVIDQQMLERSDSDILIAAPLVNQGNVIGVLVAGVNWSELAGHQDDLEIFAMSIASALSKITTTDMISVEELQRKAREISHEVNNPFSVVQNYLKILSLKLGEEHEAQGSITTIANEIQRAARIIKQYSRIGDNTVPDSAQTNCNQLVEELTTVFKSSYPNITFTTQLDSEEPVTSLSSDQLKQIIINLLKNAAEAMNAVGEILIRSTANIHCPDTSYVELEIVDNGPGIIPELREDLFAPGTTSKSDPNAGLGLGIVKDIINTAAGTISFRTGETGTAFKLLLPQTKTQTSPAKVEEPL